MKLGNNDISSFKLGSNDVNKIYLGTNELNLGSSLPLNDITGSTAGFSLRKLTSSYNGSAIQVRRASDNTTQDIGFVNDVLDTATLNTFSSGTNAFVTIWYNQIDTSNNAIQTASSNQPKIYDSSTGVETENSKPAINFIKSSSTYLEVTDTSFGNIGDAISNFSVVKPNLGLTFYPMIWSKSFSGQGSIALSLGTSNGKIKFFIDQIGVGEYGSMVDIRGSQRLISNFNDSSSNNRKIYNNSANVADISQSADLLGSNTFKFAIGRSFQGTYYFDGFVQEIMLFDNNQITNRTTIEDNINAYYSIY